METEIITAWQQARRRGETVALMANSTDTVARLNRRAQHTRITIGELDLKAPRMRAGDGWILEGDEVVTRRNDRTLCTDRGLMVKNRDHWTITTIHPDHSVTLTGRTGTIQLPAEYVVEDLELGYAQTSHATQGRTVDTALLLADTPTDIRGVYTPMTRGRESNHAYVVVDENQTAHDVLTQAITRDWIDQPAVVRKAQLDPHHTRQLNPVGPGEEDEFDELEQRVHRLIEERRRARAREAERTAGRGLELDIN
jgi:ATP-dependent exoDNAse (exonuclease V) alpha subunit